MHTALFTGASWRGPGPSEPALRRLADSLGVDGARLARCAVSEDVQAALQRDLALAAKAGVVAVPSLHLDGSALEPMAPRSVLRAVERSLH